MDKAPPREANHRVAGQHQRCDASETSRVRTLVDRTRCPSGWRVFLGEKLGDRTPAGRRPLGCQASLAICWPLKRQRAPRFRSACAKPQPDDRYCHNYRTLGSPRLWLNSTPPRVPITWEANASAAGPALGASPPVPDVGPHSENVIAEIDRETADAIEFAVARSWEIVEDGCSICLTEAGRRRVAATR